MRRHLFVVLAIVGLGATLCASLTAQTFDSVTFNGVEPDPNGVGDEHTYNLTSGGILESIVFSGVITEINTATFGSEITFDYAAGFLSGSGIQLTSTNGFTGSVLFEGVIDFAANPVASGNLWTYTFFENFDDGGDGSADASVDVTFEYRADDPVPAETDFGSFTLDQGFYDRGGAGGDEDHPWTQVAFQVNESGIFSLESDWDGFDGYLYLFDSPFTGDDSGNIGFDDDGPEGLDDSRIEAIFLETDVTYYAVMTTFGGEAGNSTLTGDLRLGSLTGKTGFLVAIPEPASGIAICLFGAAFLGRRRRKA